MISRSSMPSHLGLICLIALSVPAAAPAADSNQVFSQKIRPLLDEFCIDCHSTEEQKGELDLERFATLAAVKADIGTWLKVDEQLELDEMPPAKKPQPTAAQKSALVAWVRATMGEVARERAGDPGPVVVRRLSNAEYVYTLRDLTGVAGLDPAREFPVDGAAGEGFTNAGAALVMSPALFTKYLDAAKEVARHAVLLPDRIAFSPAVSGRDWTEEKLAAIRAFYARFTESGAGSPVNLQGIKFDTNHGGVIGLEKYFAALIEERAALTDDKSRLAAVAAERGLNAKYLGILWAALNGRAPSLLLDPIRAQWRAARQASDARALVEGVGAWQKQLWRFASVGHIGKRDGPECWQEPVVPIATAQDVRLPLPAPQGGEGIALHLVTTDGGDGAAGDAVIWEDPRILQKDGPPIRLRDLQGLQERLGATMARELARSDAYLAALAESHRSGAPVEALATKQQLDPRLIASWAALTDLGSSGVPQVDGLYTTRITNGQFPAIRGWGSDQTPSLVVNNSAETLRITTVTFPARSVVTHPSPDKAATLHWRSPIDGNVRIAGTLSDVDGNCGNGITWQLDRINHAGTSKLAGGTIDNGGTQEISVEAALAMRRGDLLQLAILPRDRDHSCDSTQVALALSEVGGDGRRWDLAAEVIDKIADANPVGDAYGNAAVWHFGASGDAAAKPSQIPPGSALEAWRQAVIENRTPAELQRAALSVRQLLSAAAPPADVTLGDGQLRAALLGWNGPLGWIALDSATRPEAAASANLVATAPSVLTFKLPAGLAAGAEFVARGILDPQQGGEGSVQMAATLAPPGEKPALASPVLVAAGGAAQARLTADMAAFRDIFPAALCYTKIVPVDEVVTLTLFYREDWHLRRLMLDDSEAAQLDRLWDELEFVSRSPLTLVDAFEQLWQYATQDADPSAFEPMRAPIKLAAEKFRAKQLAAEPHHLDAVLGIAARAWRHPLSAAEQDALRGFYRQLRESGLPHDDAIRQTLARVLVAPAFLYKLEDPPAGTASAAVSNAELATRLSYFLSSSAPDAELAAATAGLADPAVLRAQVRRLLGDARVRRLAIEFGTQWLHVRGFDQLDEKSERHFPEFAAIRSSLNEEPIRFFTDLFQRDGSVLELLDADHTFADAALAKYYGLPASGTMDWQRIDHVREHGRGGVLGFGATLAKQSGASRTSPILRGTWISETLLGERLPRPPKGVPILPEEPTPGLTEREFTARHSSDPSCARCHARFDPFGFALEEFDAIGRRRSTDAAGLTIDASAQTIDGSEFDGLAGLRGYLLTTRRDEFVRQFCRKLLGYALGRGVLLSDDPLLDAIQEQLAANDFRVSIAIEMIVQSRQFREIRGRDFPTE